MSLSFETRAWIAFAATVAIGFLVSLYLVLDSGSPPKGPEPLTPLSGSQNPDHASTVGQGPMVGSGDHARDEGAYPPGRQTASPPRHLADDHPFSAPGDGMDTYRKMVDEAKSDPNVEYRIAVRKIEEERQRQLRALQAEHERELRKEREEGRE